MAYIKRFQEIFKKEEDKEDSVAFFGSKTKTEKFSEKQITSTKSQELPGVLLHSTENAARRDGPYVTKVRIKLKNIIHAEGNYKIKRDDALFMINNAPEKSNNRSEEFSNIDHVLASKSALDGYQRIYKNFYEGHEADFVRNVSKLGYDALVVEKDGKKKYVVFNVHIIGLLKN